MAKFPLYRQSPGLNTVDDPVDIPYDPNAGVLGFAACINITHRGNKGRPGRRQGFRPLQTGIFHSLFCDGGSCFVVQDRTGDSAIMRIETNLSVAGVRSGLTKAKRISFVQDGDKTWYANGYENGFIEEGVSHAWPDQSGHVGSVTTKVFHPAPIGHHIGIGNGRMWVCRDNMAYYSEPFAYGKFALGRNYLPFHTKILMVRPVKAGVFFSDTKRIYFFSGSDPKDVSPVKVADYPAIEWSLSIGSIPGKEIGRPEAGDLYYVATPEGLCSLSTAGVFTNEVKRSVIYPERGQSGASLVRGYNVIHCIN